MTNKFGLIGILAVGLVACKNETVESEDIRTSGIYATFEVLATGNAKTTVSAQLQVGGVNSNTYVELTGVDKLTCSVAGETKTLAKDGNYYRSTFSGEAGNTEFVFALNRGEEDDTAPNSTVTLPDPFAIAGVAASDSVSRATALTVTWEPSAVKDPTTWTLDGDCLFKSDGTVPNDGTLTLAGSDYKVTPSAEQAAADPNDNHENCTVTLCVERRRQGTLDPEFVQGDGGRISAAQQRCINFVSTP